MMPGTNLAHGTSAVHDAILLITGIAVGIMNAVAGGGMLLGFPVLVALGLPPLTANVTGNLITTPGQLASAYGYRNYLRRVPKRFIILTPPLIVGAIAGTYVLQCTSPGDFERIVPFLVLFGVLLFTVQPLLHFHLKQHLHGRHKTLLPLILIALAMLPLSFYGGYFGAGFGFMMLAFLSFAHLPDTHMVNAMKNIGGATVSGTALVVLLPTGLIDLHAGLIMGTGTIIGGYSGSRVSQRLSSHWLRIIVIIIGLTAVAYLGLHRY